MKIRLQIDSIEEYFSGFFFNVHSAFKRRFRPFLAMIHDQSYLDMIAIESRTQEDHVKLTILLQKCLISSRFNRKLSLEDRRISIYKILTRKLCAVRCVERALDGCDCAKSVGHDPTTWIPLLLNYRCPIFIRVSSLSHVSIGDSPSVRLNRDR